MNYRDIDGIQHDIVTLYEGMSWKENWIPSTETKKILHGCPLKSKYYLFSQIQF